MYELLFISHHLFWHGVWWLSDLEWWLVIWVFDILSAQPYKLQDRKYIIDNIIEIIMFVYWTLECVAYVWFTHMHTHGAIIKMWSYFYLDIFSTAVSEWQKFIIDSYHLVFSSLKKQIKLSRLKSDQIIHCSGPLRRNSYSC